MDGMASAQDPPRPESMLPYVTIWVPQIVSWLGSQLVQFALIWWLTEKTGSAAVLAVSTIMGVAPQIVIGPFAGVLVDRWNRRLVMIIYDGPVPGVQTAGRRQSPRHGVPRPRCPGLRTLL
jgi:DHA3 family macrolide efflux protein-like MFS transporter